MIHRFRDYSFDLDRYELRFRDQVVDTEPKVLQVLSYLIEHRDRMVSRDELLDHCWAGLVVSDGTLSRCMSRVRQAVGQQRGGQPLIQTIHGKGYRFIGALDEIASRPASVDVSTEVADAGQAAPPAPVQSAPIQSAPPMWPVASLETDSASGLPPIEPSPLTAERRHLTVLHCALDDAHALMAQLDAEELHLLMQSLRTTCCRLVGRFGGRVMHLRDDGIVAYFGYPHVHEDDAQRAVRVGLQLVEKLMVQGLAVRIGIHSGLVIVEPQGEPDSGHEPQPPLTVGATPAVAAELSHMGAERGVVISASTARLVSGYFEQQDLGKHRLGSIDQPVRVFRISGLKSDQTRLSASTLKGLTPYVGRSAERALLHDRWSHAREGRGQVVLISGEAGIGKSRLVQVFREELRDPACMVLEAHGSPYYQNTAFHSLSQMWRRWLGWLSDESGAPVLADLQVRLSDYSCAMREMLPVLADLLELKPPAQRHSHHALLSEHKPETYAAMQFLLVHDTPLRRRQKILECMLTLLLEEAARRPVLLIVEDLHWMDPSSLGFLELLIGQIATAPVMVVLTCRSDERPVWAVRAPVTPLVLNQLSPMQSIQLISQAVAGKILPTELIKWLVDKSDGIPLFMEELTRMVVESDRVRDCGDHYELTGELDPLTVPDTLHDLLVARLDSLPVGKVIAQWCAVLGRSFSHAVLAAVIPFEEDYIRQGLDELLNAQLLYQVGLGRQARCVFRHTLVQDAAYSRILQSQRLHLHLRVARILERQFPDLVETEPEQLARHYTAAGRPERAIVYWQRAGELSVQRYALHEALRYFKQGLRLLTALPAGKDRDRQELALQTMVGPVHMALIGPAASEVEDAYHRADELCRQLGETEWRIPVLWGMWRFRLNRAELAGARALSDQMLRLASRPRNTDHLLLAHTACEATAWFGGDPSAARRHAERVHRYYDPRRHDGLAALCGGLDPVVCARFYHALASWSLGFPEQSLRHSQEALALAHELDQPYTLVVALNFTNILFLRRREPGRLLQGSLQQIAVAQKHGFDTWLMNGRICECWARVMGGDSRDEVEQIQHDVDTLVVSNGTITLPFWLGALAEVHDRFARRTRALQMLHSALDTVERTGISEWAAELHRLKGTVLLSLSRFQEAEACFRQALVVARDQKARLLELRAGTALARLWQAQDRTAEALALLAPIYDGFREGFDTVDLRDAKSLLTREE